MDAGRIGQLPAARDRSHLIGRVSTLVGIMASLQLNVSGPPRLIALTGATSPSTTKTSTLSSTSSTTLPPMQLQPPPDGLRPGTWDELYLLIKQHLGPQGYAVTTYRSKTNKLGIKRKLGVICDRGRRIRQTSGQKRLHGTSRTNECSFLCIAKRNPATFEWLLSVKNSTYNHSATLPVAHPSLRKLNITEEVNHTIKTRTALGDTPGQIISGLQIGGD